MTHAHRFVSRCVFRTDALLIRQINVATIRQLDGGQKNLRVLVRDAQSGYETQIWMTNDQQSKCSSQMIVLTVARPRTERTIKQ